MIAEEAFKRAWEGIRALGEEPVVVLSPWGVKGLQPSPGLEGLALAVYVDHMLPPDTIMVISKRRLNPTAARASSEL